MYDDVSNGAIIIREQYDEALSGYYEAAAGTRKASPPGSSSRSSGSTRSWGCRQMDAKRIIVCDTEKCAGCELCEVCCSIFKEEDHQLVQGPDQARAHRADLRHRDRLPQVRGAPLCEGLSTRRRDRAGGRFHQHRKRQVQRLRLVHRSLRLRCHQPGRRTGKAWRSATSAPAAINPAAWKSVPSKP